MNWTYNTIWTELLPNDEFKPVTCTNTKASLNEHMTGSYFIVNNYKPKDKCFNNYPAISTAIYLEFTFANVRSFQGISKLGPIKRLELHYCTKLEIDKGLSEIADDIEWLHINQSKKFTAIDDLFHLRNLKVLCLNNCAPLENLKFLKAFPELVDFRFVDTNVIDGDLTPLTEHPSLLNVGFLDKRHYNLKKKDLDEHFGEKSESEKEWIYKNEFKTYRYKLFSGIE